MSRYWPMLRFRSSGPRSHSSSWTLGDLASDRRRAVRSEHAEEDEHLMPGFALPRRTPVTARP